MVSAIRLDLEGKSSVLELMKSYLSELEGETDNNAPPFDKLAKLFERLNPSHSLFIAVRVRKLER